ncbi:MAG: MBL fold metallo-hydrolase [Cytophagales bacterium]|nr:MAG: MBL fold metallo-hydrolase [Cytophagales bacterium]
MLTAFTFSPFAENTYVVADPTTREAVVFDPGCYDQDEKEELARHIDGNNLTIKAVWLTHAHLDHVFGCAYLKRTYGAPVYMHTNEQVILNDTPSRAALYGLRGFEPFEVDGYIREGETLTIGSLSFEVRFVPGHAPGHIAFVNHAERYVIGGDVLFRQSVGRTDFPFCSATELKRSIVEQLYTLPDDYTVYPGHMESTIIGYEKKHNPFVRG